MFSDSLSRPWRRASYRGMGPDMTDDPDTDTLLRRAAAGDPEGWGTLLARTATGSGGWSRSGSTAGCRAGSTRRTSSRRRTSRPPAGSPSTSHDRPMPFFLWLRLLTGQKLARVPPPPPRGQDAGRRPGGVAVPRALPEATSAALAAQLLGRHTDPPSQAAIRAELKVRLQEALNAMDPIDREVLALRHFEHLSNGRGGRANSGIRGGGRKKRHIRAVERLQGILTERPGRTPEGCRP